MKKNCLHFSAFFPIVHWTNSKASILDVVSKVLSTVWRKWNLFTLCKRKSWMQRDNLMHRGKEICDSPLLERLIHQEDCTRECYFGSLIPGFNKKRPV